MTTLIGQTTPSRAKTASAKAGKQYIASGPRSTRWTSQYNIQSGRPATVLADARIAYFCPKQLKNELSECAFEQNIPTSVACRNALEMYLDVAETIKPGENKDIKTLAEIKGADKNSDKETILAETRVLFCAPTSLKDRLLNYADQNNTTMSIVLRCAMENYLSKYSDNAQNAA
jgi:hypothetical protein